MSRCEAVTCQMDDSEKVMLLKESVAGGLNECVESAAKSHSYTF